MAIDAVTHATCSLRSGVNMSNLREQFAFVAAETRMSVAVADAASTQTYEQISRQTKTRVWQSPTRAHCSADLRIVSTTSPRCLTLMHAVSLATPGHQGDLLDNFTCSPLNMWNTCVANLWKTAWNCCCFCVFCCDHSESIRKQSEAFPVDARRVEGLKDAYFRV